MHPAYQLLAVLAATPNLPGAVCAEPSTRVIFDECAEHPDQYAVRAAIRVCAECPALHDCSAWVADLPAAERPRGVTAGRLR